MVIQGTRIVMIRYRFTKNPEGAFVLLLLTQLIFDYIFFNVKLSNDPDLNKIYLEVSYFVPHYLCLIIIGIHLTNIVHNYKRVKKSIIYSVCFIYFISIVLNLIGLKFDDYEKYRDFVNNGWVNYISWCIILIYLIFVSCRILKK